MAHGVEAALARKSDTADSMFLSAEGAGNLTGGKIGNLSARVGERSVAQRVSAVESKSERGCDAPCK
jgi:hypothetical protein